MYIPKGKTDKMEDSNMKTKFYINGKKTTRKAIQEQLGADRLAKMMKEAKETFMDDPQIQNDFFIGNGILTITFE